MEILARETESGGKFELSIQKGCTGRWNVCDLRDSGLNRKLDHSDESIKFDLIHKNLA